MTTCSLHNTHSGTYHTKSKRCCCVQHTPSRVLLVSCIILRSIIPTAQKLLCRERGTNHEVRAWLSRNLLEEGCAEATYHSDPCTYRSVHTHIFLLNVQYRSTFTHYVQQYCFVLPSAAPLLRWFVLQCSLTRRCSIYRLVVSENATAETRE